MNHAEIFGAVTGLIYVFLEIKQNRVMWIVGGLSALVYIFIFLDTQLYAASALQLYYFGASIYGWNLWRRQTKESAGEESKLVVELSLKRAATSSIIALAGWLILWYVLLTYTQDPFPMIDSAIASMSMLATYWVANRHIEHWIIWIAADILAVYLYISQQLYATTALYIVYTFAAVAGLYHWRKFRRVLN